VLLAHLQPLVGLERLFLQRLPDVTPGVVLGLCAMLPKLQMLQFVECAGLQEGVDQQQMARWEGSELQMARAALNEAAARNGRDPCKVRVFSSYHDVARFWQELPCDVEYVSAHRRHF
jgi:hypothetical protein